MPTSSDKKNKTNLMDRKRLLRSMFLLLKLIISGYIIYIPGLRLTIASFNKKFD